MTSFNEILTMYNAILDSTIEIDCDGKIMKINKVSYTDCIFEENLKQITIIGDKSPNQDGTMKQKTITIKHINNNETIFKFDCDYSRNFFISSIPCMFKVYKHSSNDYYYNRY